MQDDATKEILSPDSGYTERASAGRRWSARVFDLLCLDLASFVALAYFGLPDELSVFLVTPLALALEGCVYAIFGTTFGRWVFATRVIDRFGKKIPPSVYFKRNLHLLFGGMWLGLPFICILPWLYQWYRVSHGKETTYDERLGLAVRQGKQSMFKFVVAIVFWISMAFLRGGLRERVDKHADEATYYSPETSISYLESESAGSPHASNALGIRYATGNGVERNLARAEECFRSAAERGVEAAWLNLAWMLCEQPERRADAEEPLRIASAKGNADAQYFYAVYLSEDETRRAESLEWLRRAAAQGHDEATKALEALPGN